MAVEKINKCDYTLKLLIQFLYGKRNCHVQQDSFTQEGNRVTFTDRKKGTTINEKKRNIHYIRILKKTEVTRVLN